MFFLGLFILSAVVAICTTCCNINISAFCLQCAQRFPVIVQDAQIVYIISVNRLVFVTYSCVFSVSLEVCYLIFVLRSSSFEGSHAERVVEAKKSDPKWLRNCETPLLQIEQGSPCCLACFPYIGKGWFVVLCTLFVCPTITFQALHCTADRAIEPYRAYHSGLYTYHQLFR